MKKVSKEKAHYRPGTKARNCDNCAYMHDDGTCTKVLGIVKKNMTSDFWKAGAK